MVNRGYYIFCTEDEICQNVVNTAHHILYLDRILITLYIVLGHSAEFEMLCSNEKIEFLGHPKFVLQYISYKPSTLSPVIGIGSSSSAFAYILRVLRRAY
jgi:hypothetical protein